MRLCRALTSYMVHFVTDRESARCHGPVLTRMKPLCGRRARTGNDYQDFDIQPTATIRLCSLCATKAPEWAKYASNIGPMPVRTRSAQ